jgi:hypothetical protein
MVAQTVDRWVDSKALSKVDKKADGKVVQKAEKMD